MSEFSESVHLRGGDLDEAVELLREAKVAGYVLPATKGWVSFVHARGITGSAIENTDRIAAVNRGVLLFYAYSEEHGCYVDVFKGPIRVARLKAAFESLNARFDRADFVDLGLVSEPASFELEKWVASAHDYEARRKRSEHFVAEKLGLPKYLYFSHAYEMQSKAPDPARVEVDRKGHVKKPAAAPARKQTLVAIAGSKRTRR